MQYNCNFLQKDKNCNNLRFKTKYTFLIFAVLTLLWLFVVAGGAFAFLNNIGAGQSNNEVNGVVSATATAPTGSGTETDPYILTANVFDWISYSNLKSLSASNSAVFDTYWGNKDTGKYVYYRMNATYEYSGTELWQIGLGHPFYGKIEFENIIFTGKFVSYPTLDDSGDAGLFYEIAEGSVLSFGDDVLRNLTISVETINY